MNLYDSMIGALREHWKANDNAYPQCFELTQASFDGLIALRRIVIEGLGSKELPGGKDKFLGVKIVIGSSNALIAKDGARVELG